MRRVALAVTLLAGAACGDAQPSPVAPTVITERIVVGPSGPPAQPSGPHFTLSLQPASSAPVVDGEAWAGVLTVTPIVEIVNPTLPVRVTTICTFAQSHTLEGFASGTAFVSCMLPVGAHAVTAQAQTSDGRITSARTTARVIEAPAPPPPPTLTLTVREQIQGVPPVLVHHFTTSDVGARRYRWSFDDHHADMTMVPVTAHAFDANGQYRVDVTALDAEGRAIGFGAVPVVVTHHDD